MELLLWLLGILVITLLLAAGAVWLGWRTIQRRNRVSPRRPGQAPMLWMWSPALAARLHRRLRSAAALARMVVGRHDGRRGGRSPDASRLDTMATELEGEAVALDDHLALVGRMRADQRRRALPAVVAEVARIEALASRLSMVHLDTGVDVRLAEQASTLHQLAVELDHLEEANDALAGIEADVGLHRPNPRQATLEDRSTPRTG